MRYHLATWAPTGGGGGGGGGKGGRRDAARGSAGCGVSGSRLPESPPPRRPLYRITIASLVGCAPRDSPPSSTARRGGAEAVHAHGADTPPELEGALPVEVAARIEPRGGAAEH